MAHRPPPQQPRLFTDPLKPLRQSVRLYVGEGSSAASQLIFQSIKYGVTHHPGTFHTHQVSDFLQLSFDFCTHYEDDCTDAIVSATKRDQVIEVQKEAHTQLSTIGTDLLNYEYPYPNAQNIVRSITTFIASLQSWTPPPPPQLPPIQKLTPPPPKT